GREGAASPPDEAQHGHDNRPENERCNNPGRRNGELIHKLTRFTRLATTRRAAWRFARGCEARREPRHKRARHALCLTARPARRARHARTTSPASRFATTARAAAPISTR